MYVWLENLLILFNIMPRIWRRNIFSLKFAKNKKIQMNEWMKVAQSCPTLWDPVDYTVHGILQATILEWVAVPVSRGSSQPRDQNQVSCIAGGFFTSWATKARHKNCSFPYSLRTDKILCWDESKQWLGNGKNLKNIQGNLG